MKNLYILFLLFITISLKAQTECIEVVAIPEELKEVKEKILNKAAVYNYRMSAYKPAEYGYRMVGSKSIKTELTVDLLSPSYTHIYNNTIGEKCKEIKPAQTYSYQRVITDEVAPTIEKYLISEAVEPKIERVCVSEAEYEIITKIIVVKDGSVKVYNKNCTN